MFPRNLQVGDIVTSPFGDAVVHEVNVTSFSVPWYDTQVLQSVDIHTISRVDLWRLTSVDELTQDDGFELPQEESVDPMCQELVQNAETTHESAQSKPRRFAVLTSPGQVDMLVGHSESNLMDGQDLSR